MPYYNGLQKIMLALKIAYELGFEIMEIQMQNGMIPGGMLTTTKKEWTNN